VSLFFVTSIFITRLVKTIFKDSARRLGFVEKFEKSLSKGLRIFVPNCEAKKY
jgi:hypothetical protein